MGFYIFLHALGKGKKKEKKAYIFHRTAHFFDVNINEWTNAESAIPLYHLFPEESKTTAWWSYFPFCQTRTPSLQHKLSKLRNLLSVGYLGKERYET